MVVRFFYSIQPPLEETQWTQGTLRIPRPRWSSVGPLGLPYRHDLRSSLGLVSDGRLVGFQCRLTAIGDPYPTSSIGMGSGPPQSVM